MVALLQFLHAGVRDGEEVALLTNVDADSVLEAAEAWGFGLREAWRSGKLRLLGFRDDFELRALRAVEPEEILEEFQALLPDEVARIAVDPGGAFLAGSNRTLLGSSFLRWARRARATVCATLTVEGGSTPVAAPDWAVPFIDGAIVLEPRTGGLQQARLLPSVPTPGSSPDAVTLALEPGKGLIRPSHFPARRLDDLAERDPDRLLLLCFGGEHAAELEAWADASFEARTLRDPLDAVSVLQHDPEFGAILLHAPRHSVKDAFRACRALRPQTRAGIVFASHDSVRSSDRIALIEAGCDDTVSGGIDFRELELRVRQAARRGRSPVPPAPVEVPPAPEGGVVEAAKLVDEVGRLMDAGSPGDTFTLLRFAVQSPGGEAQLANRLSEEVRDEDGDRVAAVEGGVIVFLMGARSHQAEAFLRRLRARLDEAGGAPEFSVRFASHPSDPDGVSRLMGQYGARDE
jgi:DNA-binding response OmpR family regulator